MRFCIFIYKTFTKDKVFLMDIAHSFNLKKRFMSIF